MKKILSVFLILTMMLTGIHVTAFDEQSSIQSKSVNNSEFPQDIVRGTPIKDLIFDMDVVSHSDSLIAHTYIPEDIEEGDIVTLSDDVVRPTLIPLPSLRRLTALQSKNFLLILLRTRTYHHTTESLQCTSMISHFRDVMVLTLISGEFIRQRRQNLAARK